MSISVKHFKAKRKLRCQACKKPIMPGDTVVRIVLSTSAIFHVHDGSCSKNVATKIMPKSA